MQGNKGFCVEVVSIYDPRLIEYEIRLIPSPHSSIYEEEVVASIAPTKMPLAFVRTIHNVELDAFFAYGNKEWRQPISDLLVSMCKQIDALPEGESTRPCIDAFVTAVAML
jgi:hypothetical protein